jgi:hypothetical protein
LRKQQFESIDDVDDAIHPSLIYLNERRFQKMPCIRYSCFAHLDSPALQPLPAQACEISVFKNIRVPVDKNVEFELHCDGFPQLLVGLRLELRVTDRRVEVLHHGKRVTCHALCTHSGGCTHLEKNIDPDTNRRIAIFFSIRALACSKNARRKNRKK